MGIRAGSVDGYFGEIRPPRGPVMAAMEDLAERDGVPIVSWETGRLLASLAGWADPRVLEVGTAIGYSALHMAETLGQGRITTLERDPERIGQARDFFQRAGVEDKVEIVEGDALETIAGVVARSTCCSSTPPRASTASTCASPRVCSPPGRCWWWTTS